MNFGGTYPAHSLHEATFVVVPVPYDLTSTYQPGSRRGPIAIIEASTNMELYDEELKKETYLAGIHTTLPVDVDARGPKNMISAVRKKISKIVALNKIPVMLGGEHSISLGAVQALKEKYPRLSVLQLDAHADLRDSYQGSPYSHASVARRISELCPLVQVGIRSMSKEEGDFLPTSNVKSYSADFVGERKDWCEKISKDTKGDVLSPSIWMFSTLPSWRPPGHRNREVCTGGMCCACLNPFHAPARSAASMLWNWPRFPAISRLISWPPN